MRHLKIVLLLTLLFMGRCVWADTPEETLSQKLDPLFPPIGPGVSILVAQDGKILFEKAYGLADREKRVAVTNDTRFRIGSITKQFIAASILRLQEQGKLSIESHLSTYFPHVTNSSKITLHQMLNHASGLHDYTAHPDFMTRVVKPIAPDDLLAYFQSDPSDFPPGTEFRYSNTNYLLLGRIVEMVSGIKLDYYLQREFFGPLGLHHTGFWHNDAPPDSGAKGYGYNGVHLVPALDWDMSWTGGAGVLCSTTEDLWHWTEALQLGHLLSPKSLELMSTVGTVTKKETQVGYGMGLFQSEVDWLPTLGHGGGLNGYHSQLTWFPVQKVTVVVLANSLPAAPGRDVDALALLADRTFLADQIAAQRPIVDPDVNPKCYPDFAGNYDYKTAILHVTAEGDHLCAQMDGQNKLELFPLAPDTFFPKEVAAKLAFNRDPSGKVTSVTHTQNGNIVTYPKLPDEQIVKVSSQALDAIVGQYQYPGAVLTVTRRGDQLYAQLTGQPEAPIFPKSDHEFYWRVASAEVEFVKGADGKVTEAVHHQNGSTLHAPKLTGK